VSFWLLASIASVASFASLALLGSLLCLALARPTEAVPDPELRARRLVSLRLMPTTFGLGIGVALVLPAFLVFEPRNANEVPGVAMLALAAIGTLAILAGMRRSFRDYRATRVLRRSWEAEGRPIQLPGAPVPAFAIRHPFPVVSVVGVLRPRLFVAEQVLEALSPEELEAVVSHECGHLASHDNLKRLLLRLAPVVAVPGFVRRLDAAWDVAAEESADARAENGLDLAAALVRTARLVPEGSRLDLPVAAFHRGDSVAHRVRVLTGDSRPVITGAHRYDWSYVLLAAGAVIAVSSLWWLQDVHTLLEPLVHVL
jgi:Zn-dependent protease with chaperone function